MEGQIAGPACMAEPGNAIVNSSAWMARMEVPAWMAQYGWPIMDGSVWITQYGWTSMDGPA